MVEINNQRKAFLDMLARSEESDNGRQKTRNHGYDVIVGGELFTDYSDHSSQTCHAKPKLNQQAPDARSFFPVGGMPLPQAAWPERLLSEKSQDAVALQQIKERGAYLYLIVVISVRQSTVAISGLHCRALVISSEHKAGQPDCKIQRSGRNGQRD